MTDGREPQIADGAAEIARAILFAKADDGALGRTIFLVGAGCSITAGIPGAAEIARRMVVVTARRLRLGGDDAVAAYAALVRDGGLEHCRKDDAATAPSEAGIDWYAVYDAMFRRYFRAPDDVRALFGGLVEDAKGAVNWAHLCLGEMVAQGLVSTVLTTNFDQLALSGMVRAGVLPVLCDGLESLNRLDEAPRHAQLVELHGSRHSYRLRNAPAEVAEVGGDHSAIAMVQKLFHSATTFVAVGYGGREDGVMDLLIRAAQGYPDKNLFWVAHSANPAEIGPKVRAFLDTSRNARLLPGQDADRFFLDLCRGLKVGSPGALSRPLAPLERLLADVRRSAVSDPDIQREIADAAAMLARLSSAGRGAAEAGDAAAASAIRELRLKGDLAAAYAAAMVALGGRDLAEVPVALLDEAGRAALSHGEQDPELEPLGVAERSFRALLNRGGGLTDRGDVWNLLGTALQRIGERKSDTARLDAAVAAYRAALEERTRDRVPLDWAATQNNLGNALSVLGVRERGTARLEEAVTAYRAALEEWTRALVPLDWAKTQNNLGNALRLLGERTSDAARLEEAVAAHRAALEERTLERVPLDWAMTQSNLGNSLSALGKHEQRTTLLEEAVVAYRAALAELTQVRMPLHWASTLNNLGTALLVPGEPRGEKKRLEEAAAAFRAALEERTRARVPLDWARTQSNLGTALAALGVRERGTARLEEAVAAYCAALEVFAESLPADQMRGTKDSLAAVEAEISRRLEAGKSGIKVGGVGAAAPPPAPPTSGGREE